MTTSTPSVPINRLKLAAPIKKGSIQALAAATYADRVAQVFEKLDAGWSSWRGHPWAMPYSSAIARIPSIHSLRMAILEPAGTVLLESSFEGEPTVHINSLRADLGPLLDLVFCSCEGYPGTTEKSDAGFIAWAGQAQNLANQPAAQATCAAAELQYLRKTERRCPFAASDAQALEQAPHALHSLADLHRLAALFMTESDEACLERAVRSLLPDLAPHAVAVPPGSALLQRFAEAVSWISGTAPGIASASQPAAIGGAASASIQVNGKRLFTEVMLDSAQNYSVSGYAGRMQQAFGLIYLGLDRADPEYLRQSAVSNAAIGMISEREAFGRAIEETRAAVKALGNPGTFDIEEISNIVLAALCTGWFDLPDGVNIIGGGWKPVVTPDTPARCPGHFAAPSGFIFQPEPNPFVQYYGKKHGNLLRQAALKFVAERRKPGKPLKGSLSKTLFAAFPNSPADDDLLARTLIGVMIGFLPTVQLNLEAAVATWLKDKTFDALRHAFLTSPEPDLYLRAGIVIRSPLIAAMQSAPVPPKIWRTALKDHNLGGNPSAPVKTGDRLSINIDSAMAEDLAAKNPDPYPVFGGDRGLAAHPTHACPGFWAGMGVLLGIIAGTMEAPPTLAPMTARSGTSIF